MHIRSALLPALLLGSAAAAAQAPTTPVAPPAAPAPAASTPSAAPELASDEVLVKGQRVKVVPLSGGEDFISPMGEPFHSPDKLSGAEHWFRTIDANHDNKITREEMRAEADRFFQRLDTNHDGEIDPAELSHYEQVIAPEILVLSTYGDMSQAKTDDDGKLIDPPYPTRLGAGRYSYLAMPEPVSAADLNFDRATSRAEFQTAADRRFRMLDFNGDGLITRDELPKLSASHGRDEDGPPRGRRGGGGGGRGGGHGGMHGGMGGGGMGGMGGAGGMGGMGGMGPGG